MSHPGNSLPRAGLQFAKGERPPGAVWLERHGRASRDRVTRRKSRQLEQDRGIPVPRLCPPFPTEAGPTGSESS